MLKNEDTKVTFIIWFALIISTLLYVVIGYILMKDPQASSKADPETYKMYLAMFSFAALLAGIFSILSRRLLLKKKYYLMFFKGNATAKQIYTITIILSSAVAESVAISGLILSMAGKNIKIQIAFSFVAIVIMLINKPSLAEYENFKKEFEETPESEESF